MLQEQFPGFRFSDQDVIYHYCGVRPLPAMRADNPGDISRDHVIHLDYAGTTPVLSLVGGKWTTFRGLAEETADKVLALLHRQRHSSSRMRAIGGGTDYPTRRTRETYLRQFAKNMIFLSKELRSCLSATAQLQKPLLPIAQAHPTGR